MLGDERRLHPQSVPPWLCRREQPLDIVPDAGAIDCPLDCVMHLGFVGGQWHNAIASCQRVRLKALKGVRGASAAYLFDCRKTAIDFQRVVDPKSVWRFDAKAVKHAAVAASVADRPGRPQLPLGPLWIAAILKAANRALILNRPDEEFRRVHFTDTSYTASRVAVSHEVNHGWISLRFIRPKRAPETVHRILWILEA
jgi:hypothetical protein